MSDSRRVLYPQINIDQRKMGRGRGGVGKTVRKPLEGVYPSYRAKLTVMPFRLWGISHTSQLFPRSCACYVTRLERRIFAHVTSRIPFRVIPGARYLHWISYLSLTRARMYLCSRITVTTHVRRRGSEKLRGRRWPRGLYLETPSCNP